MVPWNSQMEKEGLMSDRENEQVRMGLQKRGKSPSRLSNESLPVMANTLQVLHPFTGLQPSRAPFDVLPCELSAAA